MTTEPQAPSPGEVSNADWYADLNQGRRGPPHPTDEQITAMRANLAASNAELAGEALAHPPLTMPAPDVADVVGRLRWMADAYEITTGARNPILEKAAALIESQGATVARLEARCKALEKAVSRLIEDARPSNWDEIDRDYEDTTTRARNAWLAAAALLDAGEAK